MDNYCSYYKNLHHGSYGQGSKLLEADWGKTLWRDLRAGLLSCVQAGVYSPGPVYMIDTKTLGLRSLISGHSGALPRQSRFTETGNARSMLNMTAKSDLAPNLRCDIKQCPTKIMWAACNDFGAQPRNCAPPFEATSTGAVALSYI